MRVEQSYQVQAQGNYLKKPHRPWRHKRLDERERSGSGIYHHLVADNAGIHPHKVVGLEWVHLDCPRDKLLLGGPHCVQLRRVLELFLFECKRLIPNRHPIGFEHFKV